MSLVISEEGRSRRPGCVIAALILGIVLGCSQAARAGSIVQIGGGTSSSLQGLGSFAGSISYSAASMLSTTGTLVVTLTNTTTGGNGGFVTGLLFNVGSSDSNATATLVNGTHPFTDCTGGGLNGAPYGDFDAGSALGGSFLGAGSPNPGIAIGQTGVFTFNVNAADAGMLSAMDFLSGGAFDFNFLVRFKGFDDGASDKVGAIVVDLPPALGLGVLGLFGATLVSRLKRRAVRKPPE